MAGIGTWTFDITDGVLRNNEISAEILRASYESTRVMEFVKTKPFGKHKGTSLTVPRVHAITEPTDATVAELGGIPEDVYSISAAQIVVGEMARTLPYTSLESDLLEFDLENELQDLLREQMALVFDTASVAAFKTAKIVYTPTGAATNTITTNGTPGALATTDLNVFHVEEIVKYLIETLFAPPYDGDDYMAICRYKSLLAIRRDVAWQTWHQYLSPEEKYAGEVGRLERVRFVETNHVAALANVGSGSILGEALFFGKTPVYMAEAVTPELRAGIPTDLGRKKLVGWYGVLGWKQVWDTGNPREARVVAVRST